MAKFEDVIYSIIDMAYYDSQLATAADTSLKLSLNKLKVDNQGSSQTEQQLYALHYCTEGMKANLSPSPFIDIGYYAAHASVPLSKAVQHCMMEGLALGINPSPIFDVAYYASVATVAFSETLIHFLTKGIAQKLNPSPYCDLEYCVTILKVAPSADKVAMELISQKKFIPTPYLDINYYRQALKDPIDTDWNAFLYFVNHADDDNISPSPFLDLNYYLRQLSIEIQSAIKQKQLSTTRFFFATGITNVINPSLFFDVQYYASINNITPQQAVKHFFITDSTQRQSPFPLLDCHYYLRQRQKTLGDNQITDVISDFFIHADEYDPSPYFNRNYYAQAQGVSPKKALRHFLLEGLGQGYNPSLYFDVEYCAVIAKVNKSDVLRYFFTTGIKAGGNSAPFFDPHYYIAQLQASSDGENKQAAIDIQQGHLTVLEHLISHGLKQGLYPSSFFDVDFYLSQFPDKQLPTKDDDPYHYFLKYDIDNPERSPYPLFDPHYCRVNMGIATLRNFLIEGIQKPVSPTPFFDSNFYKQQLDVDNCKLIDSGVMTAFEHYLRIGEAKNINPSPVFDVAFYRSHIVTELDSILKKQISLLQYFIDHDRARISPSPFFDMAHYTALTGTSIDHAIEHYLLEGKFLGVNPTPYFDVDYYVTLAQIPVSDALQHYLLFGSKQGLNPSPFFNRSFYTTQLTQQGNDVENLDVFYYFLTKNRENISPSPFFDIEFYKKQLQYSSIQNAKQVIDGNMTALRHFIEWGESAGLSPTPFFDISFYQSMLPLEIQQRITNKVISAIRYFLLKDLEKSSVPTPFFDSTFYIANYKLKAATDKGISSDATAIEALQKNPFSYFMSQGIQHTVNPLPIFDPAYYDGNLRSFLIEDDQEKINRNPSVYFNKDYYLSIRASTNTSMMEAVKDFLMVGCKQLVNPSVFVDLDYYAQCTTLTGPEVLRHFILVGSKKGLSLSPLFDIEFYKSQLDKQNPDIQSLITQSQADTSKLFSYFIETCEKNEDIPTSPYFDATYYQNNLDKTIRNDIANRKISLFRHFAREGMAVGCNPSIFFDIHYYVTKTGVSNENAIQHYLLKGGRALVNPSLFFDTTYYLRQAEQQSIGLTEDISLGKTTALRYFLMRGYQTNASTSPFVDIEFCNKQMSLPNNKPQSYQETTIYHYLVTGEKSDINPTPFFDPDFYRGQIQDKTILNRFNKHDISTLRYYLQEGASLSPHPFFNESFYLDQIKHQDLTIADSQTAFYHFIVTGIFNKLNPNPFFDTDYYENTLSERKISSELYSGEVNSVLRYFLMIDEKCGISPSPFFDVTYYQQQLSNCKRDPTGSSDIASHKISAIRYFLEKGEKAGDPTTPFFDDEYYQDTLKTKQDIPSVTSTTSSMRHFLLYGLTNGLSPSPFFDPVFYCEQLDYRELQQINNDNPAIRHFLIKGEQRGISPTPIFDVAYYSKQLQIANVLPNTQVSLIRNFIMGNNNVWFNPTPFFDDAYYLLQASSSTVSPPIPTTDHLARIKHFLIYGIQQGLSPAPFFELWYYIKAVQVCLGRDVTAFPFRHFILWGEKEGIIPSPLFDSDYYLSQLKQNNISTEEIDKIKKGNVSAIRHFLQTDIASRCSPMPFFTADFYKQYIFMRVNQNFSGVVSGQFQDFFNHLLYGSMKSLADIENLSLPIINIQNNTIDWSSLVAILPWTIENITDSLNLNTLKAVFIFSDASFTQYNIQLGTFDFEIPQRLDPSSILAGIQYFASEELMVDRRGIEYFFLSHDLYTGGFPDNQNVDQHFKQLAKAFARSEFLQNRAFDGSVSHEIAEVGIAPTAVSDLKDLLMLDYVDSDENSSVYGPAAYFYDLVRIVLSCIKIGDKGNLNNVKHTLFNRRPDLLDIPLNDENSTKLLIPTLSIVNYVLARHIEPNLLLSKVEILTASGTSTTPKTFRKPTYLELMDRYEMAAFTRITQDGDVFHWPFMLDYESQQIYLNAMGKSLYDVSSDMAIINRSSTDSTQVIQQIQNRLAMDYLGISYEILEQLAAPTNIYIDIANQSIDTQVFCKKTHLSYQRLAELLRFDKNDNVARQYMLDVNNISLDTVDSSAEDLNTRTSLSVFYINQTNSASKLNPLTLTLDRKNKQETLCYVTSERMIRLGIFDCLSKQLNWNCDELELILAVLHITAPKITNNNAVQLSLVKKLQNTFKLSIPVIANLLVKNSDTLLYSAAMNNIRPVYDKNSVWQLHWYLLSLYIQLLKTDVKTEQLCAQAITLLDTDCQSFVGYQDIRNDLNHFTDGSNYFRYYANQTLSYLARLTGLGIEEISKVINTNISSLNSDEIIKFSYILGQLKQCYGRTLTELSQLFYYLFPPQNSITDINTLTEQSILGLYQLLQQDVSAVSRYLFKIHKFNGIVLAQQWNLNDLMFIRFGIVAVPSDNTQMTQLSNIQQNKLTQPFFTDLQQQQTNALSSDNTLTSEQWWQQQLENSTFLSILESNVANCFGIDTNILHRIISSFDDASVALYNALLSNDSSTSVIPVIFLQRITSLVNIFKLKGSDYCQNLRQRMDFVLSQTITTMQQITILAQRLKEFYSTLDFIANAETLYNFEPDDTEQPNNDDNLNFEVQQWSRKFKMHYIKLDQYLKYLSDSLPYFNNRTLGGKAGPVEKFVADFQQKITAYQKQLKSLSDNVKALQTASTQIDDIGVLIQLLFDIRNKTFDNYLISFVISANTIDLLKQYRDIQKALGDSNNKILLTVWTVNATRTLTNIQDTLMMNLLHMDLSAWNNLKSYIFPTIVDSVSTETTVPVKLDNILCQLNKIIILQKWLNFFTQDDRLVLTFLQQNDPKFIAEHLAQVLKTKDNDAYDKAVRKLAERKRDVLVDAVLRKFHSDASYDVFDLTNANKLSEYLLIDVSMNGDDTDTPVVQAHSTMQWYLRRCVEGVEQQNYGVKMSLQIPEQWWQWLQNYRVWEANREIFLYPENFLSPELRFTQSQQFSQLVASVHKSYLDDDIISQAYLKYLADVMKLREIEVCASCAQDLSEPDSQIKLRKLYFIGCTSSQPAAYYYRTVEETTDSNNVVTYQWWSFWKKIDVAIGAEKSPTTLNGSLTVYNVVAVWMYDRLYLYWLDLKKVEGKKIDLGNTGAKASDASVVERTDYNYQLFCSYLHLDDSWQPSQIVKKGKVEWDGESYVNLFAVENTSINLGTVNSSEWFNAGAILTVLMSNNSVLISNFLSSVNFVSDLSSLLSNNFNVTDLFLPSGLLKPSLPSINNVLSVFITDKAVPYLPDLSLTLPHLAVDASFSPSSSAFYTYLSNLHNTLAGKPLNAMFQVDQSALQSLPYDHPQGQYYWELLNFAPMVLANTLQTTSQYDKALTWYKSLFDPSRYSMQNFTSTNISPFVFAPFTVATGNNILSPLLTIQDLQDFHLHIADAHRMAQLRGSLPYKKYTVMQYVRNLLAWGDSLFTTDTRESITEALSRYLAASDLLGDAPRQLYSAKYPTKQAKTVYELLEITNKSTHTSSNTNQALVIYPYNYSTQAYFHVPENKEFMALWDQVADRLYKIRHCLNINGIKQQLALLSPPIDPHQLISAIAARGGEFVSDLLNQLSNQAHPYYRFSTLIERAKEFTGFVERLGDALLSVLERQDSAALVKLNNDYAETILNAMISIRQANIDESSNNVTLLTQRQSSIQSRIDYYSGLLSNGGMIAAEIAAEPLLAVVATLNSVIGGVMTASQLAGTAPEAVAPLAVEEGGEQAKSGIASAAGILSAAAGMTQWGAELALRQATYIRRKDEWSFQQKLAQNDLSELQVQQAAANIRLQVAQTELVNHQLAIQHQQNVNDYNNTRFTNVDLYGWLADQLYSLYSDAYQLALRSANQAAQAYQYELGKAPSLLTSGFWSVPRKGLLAGHKLAQQLNQMQQDYLSYNQRWPEIEKVISLRDVVCKDPIKDWPKARENLKKGSVNFTLSAEIFNKDFNTQDTDKRRIKMISVSVPALTGPNQQVNLTLTNTTNHEKIYISKGVASTGMFSPNFQDSRYLPFEGLDLDDSNWVLAVGSANMSPEIEKIYDSITDIQLRIYYIIQPKFSLSM